MRREPEEGKKKKKDKKKKEPKDPKATKKPKADKKGKKKDRQTTTTLPPTTTGEARSQVSAWMTWTWVNVFDFVSVLPLAIPTEPPTEPEPYTEYSYPDIGKWHTLNALKG